MRSDLFVKLKYDSSAIILFVGIGILCVTYFLTSVTMPGRKLAICVKYGKLCQRFLWHQLALASCEFYVLIVAYFFWATLYVCAAATTNA